MHKTMHRIAPHSPCIVRVSNLRCAEKSSERGRSAGESFSCPDGRVTVPSRGLAGRTGAGWRVMGDWASAKRVGGGTRGGPSRTRMGMGVYGGQSVYRARMSLCEFSDCHVAPSVGHKCYNIHHLIFDTAGLVPSGICSAPTVYRATA